VNKGKRLYECGDCKERHYLAWRDFNRAARPRCAGCGSVRLELCSTEGKAERVRLNQERVAGTGGSLVLGSGGRPGRTHRKVT
jgi:DNA-directed RNA polymerase subunit RPC12/RpoP